MSAEWVATIATGLVALLVALWILKAQGALWRGWIWDQVGADVQETAHALRGEVRPRWTGWQVRAPSARVTWRGGTWGVSTQVVSKAHGRQRQPGLLDHEAVAALLRDDPP